MKLHSVLVWVLVACLSTTMFSSAIGQTKDLRDGQVRTAASGDLQAWDIQASEWVALDDFWVRYADRRGGLTWGRRADLPPYDQTKELDTMIIEVKGGPCLMEFFHTRWRRANDVRRWDTAFNKYGGCPNVFD